MIAFLEGPDLLVVLVIVLLMFGGTKLPQLARSLGQAQKEFQRGLRDEPEPDDKAHDAGTETGKDDAPAGDAVARAEHESQDEKPGTVQDA